jgi:hypothetical protein
MDPVAVITTFFYLHYIRLLFNDRWLQRNVTVSKHNGNVCPLSTHLVPIRSNKPTLVQTYLLIMGFLFELTHKTLTAIMRSTEAHHYDITNRVSGGHV